MNINHPYHIAGNRRTAQPKSDTEHIYQMIEQVLFTTPGERVNRPDFGADLRSIIFTPADEQLLVGTQALVQSALQRWLGDSIKVEAVEVTTEETTLYITVRYVILKTRQLQTVRFEKGGASVSRGYEQHNR
jgi:uncharacterized protein